MVIGGIAPFPLRRRQVSEAGLVGASADNSILDRWGQIGHGAYDSVDAFAWDQPGHGEQCLARWWRGGWAWVGAVGHGHHALGFHLPIGEEAGGETAGDEHTVRGAQGTAS